MIYVGAAVGLLGMGFMFGSISHLSGSVLIGLTLLVAMTAFFILLLSVSVWVNRTQERVKIFVDGDYSLELLRELAGRIEDSLLRNGLSYEKYGNTFQLELERKERIIVALTAEEVFEDTKYLLILRTNRSRDSSVYTSLKAEISRIVHDIEREKGIDSYPKVKRVVCRKCRRDVSYVIATDQFYCSKCRKYEKEKDVYVVGSEPYRLFVVGGPACVESFRDADPRRLQVSFYSFFLCCFLFETMRLAATTGKMSAMAMIR